MPNGLWISNMNGYVMKQLRVQNKVDLDLLRYVRCARESDEHSICVINFEF